MKNAGTLLLVSAGIGAAVWYFSKNAGAQTVEINGRKWAVKKVTATDGTEHVDVYAPAGSWGPHAEMLVLRYDAATKVLSGVGKDVPIAMRDAALAAFDVKVPGT